MLEFIIQIIAEFMHAAVTDSNCPKCEGKLEWSKFFGKNKSVRCTYCKREWIKN